jgi:YegS/Rv2252/BmrU family lipid kinase
MGSNELVASSMAHNRGRPFSIVDKRPVRKTRKLTAPIYTVLIVNPNSRSGLTGKNWESLETSIRRVLRENLQVVFSKKQGDGSVLARTFLKRGFRKVIAIGGDGTINEVANGFFEEPAGIYGKASGPLKPINPDAVMGIVPCGTRNVLSKSLGLPETVVKCCRNFASGKPRKIDVVRATVKNPNDHSSVSRIYLNAAEIGLGAEIAERSRKVRKVLSNRIVSTATGILATLPSYQSNECEVLLDGHREKIKMTMAIVTNGKFLAGGFKTASNAEMSDGLLDVVIVKDAGSLKMLGELFSMKSGEYDKDSNVIYRQSRKASLKSTERDVTVTVDGETIGILPATFKVARHALNIMM